VVDHPSHCVAGKTGPQVDFECDTQRTRYGDCMSECLGASGSAGECALSCDGSTPYGVSCVVKDGALGCVCTSGPKAGHAFSIDGDCASDWSRPAKEACKP
jgi:hypothetical protein